LIEKHSERQVETAVTRMGLAGLVAFFSQSEWPQIKGAPVEIRLIMSPRNVLLFQARLGQVGRL